MQYRPARVPGTAMVFLHKYFARNSMTRNDPLARCLPTSTLLVHEDSRESSKVTAFMW